jgi:hypothetical protein
MSPRKASTSASGPLISTMTDSGPRSTIRPRLSSTTLRISARFESVARTFTSASSCSTVGSLVTSWTFRTSMSRYSCFAACSTATSSPWRLIVIRDNPA